MSGARRWTPAEDAVVSSSPLADAARQIGRSYGACQTRRDRLRSGDAARCPTCGRSRGRGAPLPATDATVALAAALADVRLLTARLERTRRALDRARETLGEASEVDSRRTSRKEGDDD